MSKTMRALVEKCLAEFPHSGMMTAARASPTLKQVLKRPPSDQAEFAMVAGELLGECYLRDSTTYSNDSGVRWSRVLGLGSILHVVLARQLVFEAEELNELIRNFMRCTLWHTPKAALVRTIEHHRMLIGTSAKLDETVRTLQDVLEESGESGKLKHRLAVVLGMASSAKPVMPFQAGDAWADAAIAELKSLGAKTAQQWCAVAAHGLDVSGSSPSGKWMKSGLGLVADLGVERFASTLLRWFPLVERPAESRANEPAIDPVEAMLLNDQNMDILKGLCWLCTSLPAGPYSSDLARALGRLALSAYKKVPGVGPRAIRVGHAAIYALGELTGPAARDALAQLAMLKVKVKFIPAQKGIDKALTSAAQRLGLPRDEIEELAVPSYGLGGEDGRAIGVREETLGDLTVRLVVRGVGDIETVYLKKDGKHVKAVPAAIKASHADDLKDLKATTKDISAMLPAQRDRLDAMFLEQRSWAMPTWRERYLDHPLMGVLARRIIWSISDGPKGPARNVAWLDGGLKGGLDGGLVDSAGRAQTFSEEAAIVRLWHPLEDSTEGVLAWRRFFEDRGIRQPFKQAHREVYLLTDAERHTRVYSNRFAAHVLRQHQFHALAGLRNWRNTLRLLVDQEFPPARRALAAWGLRAEFWIEGAGDDFGTDTNESGAFHYLTTDQVRFYEGQDQEPMPIERVPALVLSEVMRDVDLFVGVASVGNNPNWHDGGPDQRFQAYWNEYGFGELSGTGESRREFLGRLLPRLKIAAACELGERFLTVKGRLREYKIHLGSGNIMMKPDDQYLCIVPKPRETAASGLDVSLPFDGDRTLSIILSKAFMLAADDQIKDPSIVSQIRRGDQRRPEAR